MSASSSRTSGSVLVKCKPALGVSNIDLISITIPVDDQLITMKELKHIAAKKVSGLLRLSQGQQLRLSDFTLSWGQIKCSSGRELEYYMPFHQPVVFHANISCSVPKQERVFTVIIRPINGRRISMHVTTSTLVEELKVQLEERTGIHVDQQRLLYTGKQLDDSQSMGLYDITEGSELVLLARLRGGLGRTLRFADISNNSNMQVLQWVESAPAWCMAAPGLSIEGHCCNPTCAANGEMVVCNRGMGLFDLVVDAHMVACPICNTYVQPETCAFNNCGWRYSGIKARNAAFDAARSSDWTEVGDEYHLFSDQPECLVNWSRLLVSTRPRQQSSASGECSICLVDLSCTRSDPDMVTSCGHRYHVSCIEAWKSMGRSTCPMCRHAL